MIRIIAALMFPVLLPACAAVPDWFARPPQASGPVRSALARYSFDWRLSGSQAVAPMQVFDDGRRTWLQFAPHQPVPAIFERAAGGERPLSYAREGPYIVLPGVWPELVFRGGALQAMARRMPGGSADTDGAQATRQHDAPVDGGPRQASGKAADAAAAQVSAVSVPSVAEPQALSASAAPDASQAAAPMAAGHAPDPAVSAEHYQVSPRDLTLRAALARWARAAGWTFEPEHWTVDADIPIVGSARFDLEFKPAVQELVASTELADKPLQPCFYSNRVLRIVPYAQSCDRTVGSSRAS
ncbi:TcpQ domain-containing protein [Pusillimonas sp. SM2304]|uniref:TcpQ domain-containing protein n=1 Tax=Pusillimonas sp. SM2304 TaxID=3073241 RepID=UPI0028758AEB|nr:TcpQ domain-containing protein [Pusillimonas sp. SM2304]MDS1141894.1 TcpQ domain-containing protein [Pusillimonas sp. SM2304]